MRRGLRRCPAQLWKRPWAPEEGTGESDGERHGRDGRRKKRQTRGNRRTDMHRGRGSQRRTEGPREGPAEMSGQGAAVPHPLPAPCAHLVAPESHVPCHSQRCWAPPAARVPLPRPAVPPRVCQQEALGPREEGPRWRLERRSPPNPAPAGQSPRSCARVSGAHLCCTGQRPRVSLRSACVRTGLGACVRVRPCVCLGRRGDSACRVCAQEPATAFSGRLPWQFCIESPKELEA